MRNTTGQPNFTNRPENDDPYVLYVVVDETNPAAQADVMQAFTMAFVTALDVLEGENSQELEEWSAGRIRKVVKRARNAAWSRSGAESPVQYFEASQGPSTVRVYTPMRQSEQFPALKKLQLSGLNLLRGEADVKVPYLTVQYDESLGMSAGKLIAQVGHAVQLFRMLSTQEEFHAWEDSHYCINVTGVAELSPEAWDLLVHDAGLTEVAAESLTCVARFMR